MSRRERIRAAIERIRQQNSDDPIEPFEGDGQQPRRGAQAAQAAARGSKAALRRAARAAANADVPEPDEDRREALARRAERVAQARAPVDASLDVSGNPRQMEQFASSGLSVDASRAQVDEDEFAPLALAGTDVDGDGRPEGEADPLAFADPFGLSGDDRDDRDSGGDRLL